MHDDFYLDPVDDLDQIEVTQRVARIERVPAHRVIEGTVCCERLFRMPTHYNGQRTVLCPGVSACAKHKELRLQVYFLCAIWESTERRVSWYQLTASPAKALLFGCKTLARPLFGVSVKVERQWKALNAPIKVHVNPYVNPTMQLPKPMTPEKSVKAVFFSPVEKTSTRRQKAV